MDHRRRAEARAVTAAQAGRRLFLWTADGVAAGWVLLLMLVWTDVGRIGTLMRASEHGELSMALLAAVFGVTFGFWGLLVGAILSPGGEGR
jgi:hypothetical protein